MDVVLPASSTGMINRVACSLLSSPTNRHLRRVADLKWAYLVADDFFTKQLPHNVTWALTLLYAVDHPGDFTNTAVQGMLVHEMRYLASVVTQCFTGFGELLALQKRFSELTGGMVRVSEMLEVCDKAAHAMRAPHAPTVDSMGAAHPADRIAFDRVAVVTPAGACLARELSFQVRHIGVYASCAIARMMSTCVAQCYAWCACAHVHVDLSYHAGGPRLQLAGHRPQRRGQDVALPAARRAVAARVWARAQARPQRRVPRQPRHLLRPAAALHRGGQPARAGHLPTHRRGRAAASRGRGRPAC